MVYPVM